MLPKAVRNQLGLAGGDRLTVRVEADEVILRKSAEGSWRDWEGRFKGADLLTDLARERRPELAGNTKSP